MSKQPKPCPDCLGTGRDRVPYGEPCDHCNGTGNEPGQERTPPMNEVTAEVVEVPKPERPEMWVNIYFDNGKTWSIGVPRASKEDALKAAARDYHSLIRIPASTTAPEPDWVAELLKSGRPIFAVHFDGLIQCQLHGSDSTKAYGPTPALAAKACVLKLRAGGAT